MRTGLALCWTWTAALATACASFPNSGPLEEESSSLHPRIVAVDTSHPPRFVSIQLDQPGYVALVLVAPGHSATLLYPMDSLTSNRLGAGVHQLALQIPNVLVMADSIRNPDRVTRIGGRQVDSSILNPGRQRSDTSIRSRNTRPAPISPSIPTYLLLLTSTKPLVYRRIIDKTAGVSIPTSEDEALNAVAKAVKSTILDEPRDVGGYYLRTELRKRN